MPIEIEGTLYFTAADIHQELRVSRQTLWRWRRDKKIPLGRRYRERQLLYTSQDMVFIRGYANRLEPAQISHTRRSA